MEDERWLNLSFAEIASFSLNDMITGFDENTSAYTHLPAKNPYPHSPEVGFS